MTVKGGFVHKKHDVLFTLHTTVCSVMEQHDLKILSAFCILHSNQYTSRDCPVRVSKAHNRDKLSHNSHKLDSH